MKKLVNSLSKNKGSKLTTSIIEENRSKLEKVNHFSHKYELEELKYGLCSECKKFPNTGENWCRFCNAKHFQDEFKNWTSGNLEVDELIQECQIKATNQFSVLEWFDCEKFNSFEQVGKGGFGTVYKAKWSSGYIKYWNIKESRWERSKYSKEVALKILNNSQNITKDFLQEVAWYKLVNDKFSHIVRCYGISRDLRTRNYIIVMQYILGSNLRQHSWNNYNKLDFETKLNQLYYIIKGLNSIHQQGLVHRDLHPGNILIQDIGNKISCFITDLGLCIPANEVDKGKIFGILPYVAPEVLQGQSYTQASDVYSFGMIAYEIFTTFPPYHEYVHDELLAIKICQVSCPLRPLFLIRIPSLLESLIKRCWDANPLNRPTTSDLREIFKSWYGVLTGNFSEKKSEIYRQHKEAEKLNRILLTTPYQFYPQVTRSYENSKLLPNLKKTWENKQTSPLIEFDMSGLVKVLEEEDWTNINPSFTKELIQSWKSQNFTPSQTQDYLSIGLQPTETNFAAYLRDTKHLTPETALNQANYERLKEEYRVYQEQLQFQQEQSPKRNL